MKTIVTFAILASIAAAPAGAATFTRDGETYSYEVSEDAASQLIAGRNLATGAVFRLRVEAGRVVGRYGDHQVSFPVGETKSTGLAARTTSVASN